MSVGKSWVSFLCARRSCGMLWNPLQALSHIFFSSFFSFLSFWRDAQNQRPVVALAALINETIDCRFGQNLTNCFLLQKEREKKKGKQEKKNERRKVCSIFLWSGSRNTYSWTVPWCLSRRLRCCEYENKFVSFILAATAFLLLCWTAWRKSCLWIIWMIIRMKRGRNVCLWMHSLSNVCHARSIQGHRFWARLCITMVYFGVFIHFSTASHLCPFLSVLLLACLFFLKNQACRRQIRVWCHGTISNGSYKILLLTCHHFNNNRTFVLQSWPVVMTASASAMGGRGFNSHHDQTPTGSLKNGVCAGPIAAIWHLFSRALDWP